MKVKQFRATTMSQTLALVKSEMGSDAVIVHTRTLKRGGIFGIGARNIVEIIARPGTDLDGVAPLRTTGSQRLRRTYGVGRGGAQPGGDSADQTDIGAAGRAVGVAGSRTGVRTTGRLATGQAVGQIADQRTGYHDSDVGRFSPSPPRPNASDTDALSEGLKAEIGNIRTLVEDLVKEQRHLHAPQMPEQLFDFYLDLIQREVADNIARELIDSVRGDMTGNQMASVDVVRQKVLGIMEKMINTAGPIGRNINGQARVVALIGPTGVGKTTTIAKLAANFKIRQNKRVGLITIDTYRIGAVDQLRMYSEIINVPLKVALSPAELTHHLSLMRDMDVVLIDTAGRSQNDELKLRELQTFLAAASPHEIHLVLSSTAHQSHMLSAVEKFKGLGVDRLILTKLDEAISFGVVLSVLRKIDASLSYITTGQDVPNDIELCSGHKLARRLLGLNEQVAFVKESAEGLLV